MNKEEKERLVKFYKENILTRSQEERTAILAFLLLELQLTPLIQLLKRIEAKP